MILLIELELIFQFNIATTTLAFAYITLTGDVYARLLARMLVCTPQSIQGFRRTVEAFTNYDLVDFNERIETLCTYADKFKKINRVVELAFDERARALWISATNQIEQQISETGLYRSIKDIASKVMNNASRIAALLHFYHHGVVDDNQSRVTEAELQSALNLMWYFLNQALCLFGEKSEEQLRLEHAKLLFNYLRNNYSLVRMYTEKSIICSNGPRPIRKAERAQIAIDKLVSDGLLSVSFCGKKPLYWYTSRWFNEAGFIKPANYTPAF